MTDDFGNNNQDERIYSSISHREPLICMHTFKHATTYTWSMNRSEVTISNQFEYIVVSMGFCRQEGRHTNDNWVPMLFEHFYLRSSRVSTSVTPINHHHTTDYHQHRTIGTRESSGTSSGMKKQLKKCSKTALFGAWWLNWLSLLTPSSPAYCTLKFEKKKNSSI